jgi:hypothetical protein
LEAPMSMCGNSIWNCFGPSSFCIERHKEANTTTSLCIVVFATLLTVLVTRVKQVNAVLTRNRWMNHDFQSHWHKT